MRQTDLKLKHAQLRKAYKRTERKLDKAYSDALAEKFARQFDELVAHEKIMIAAGLAC